jgi:hypothetical protein
VKLVGLLRCYLQLHSFTRRSVDGDRPP